MNQRIPGELEIDAKRGVIYFHASSPSVDICPTPLRICRLPKPIPLVTFDRSLDITHMHGADWGGK